MKIDHKLSIGSLIRRKIGFLFSNRLYLSLIIGFSISGIIYFNSTHERSKDKNFTINLNSELNTNQDLVEINTKACVCENEPLSKKQIQNLEFSVNKNGFWGGLESAKWHQFDKELAKEITSFLTKEQASSVLELGAGMGEYSKKINEANILISCYDGNPQTQDLSNGRCGIVDLSKSINFARHDWILSLEVGEHIPMEFEDVFFNNLHKCNKKGMILSWAVPGQGGESHVNPRTNDYIKKKLQLMGYVSDLSVENNLRKVSTLAWFKNTIMVFRKEYK